MEHELLTKQLGVTILIIIFMQRSSYILMRWWLCPLCTKITHLVVFWQS